ncbi:hypothetical protein K4F52_006899 [Lecanicillium sp. MT-2017a]|nr:hypothetical protein K4F52_006899 [Lecanicillium sp. MT-2017a]
MRPATLALAAAATANTVLAIEANDANSEAAADIGRYVAAWEQADAAAADAAEEAAKSTSSRAKFPHNPPHHTSHKSSTKASHKVAAHATSHAHEARDAAAPCSSSSSHSVVHVTPTKKPCPTMTTTKKHPSGTGTPCPPGSGHHNGTAPGHHGGNGTDCHGGCPKPTGPKTMPPTAGAGVSDRVVPVAGGLVAIAVAFMLL